MGPKQIQLLLDHSGPESNVKKGYSTFPKLQDWRLSDAIYSHTLDTRLWKILSSVEMLLEYFTISTKKKKKKNYIYVWFIYLWNFGVNRQI